MSLSARQEQVMKVIKAFASRGYAPRMEEIGAAVGIRSTFAVRYQVKALETKGYLRPRTKGQHRSIVLADRALKAAA